MIEQEIQAALAGMVKAMLDKGVVRPDASLHFRANARPVFCLEGAAKTLGGENYVWNHGDTIAEAIGEADAFIASLPAPETVIMRTYLGKLADAVDYGHENGIAAEYVDPVRITQKAMSDNLIGVTQ